MREKIKRCLCGGRPQIVEPRHKIIKNYFLKCPECGSNSSAAGQSTKHLAIIYWNKTKGIKPGEKYIK